MVIAAWNLYAIDRLLRCKALLDQSSRGAEDVDVHQMYAFLGRRALGDGGASAFPALGREGDDAGVARAGRRAEGANHLCCTASLAFPRTPC